MRTANLYVTENGYAWSANYATGGMDLINAAENIKKSAAEYIPLGRRTVHERAVEALKGYSASNARQGYCTSEQAYSGKRAKVFVPRKHRRSILETVIDFFTCEVEE